MISTRLTAATALVVLLATAGPAGAHGDIQGTDPAQKARLKRAPGSVAITFTEAPTRQAVLEVRDGCKRDVTQGVEVADATATARVAVGQPGTWRVSYRVISALDGHQTNGSYTFTVAGRKDCTPDETDPSSPPGDATEAAPTDDGEDTGSGSGAPVVPVAFGAVAVIVLAFILRRAGSR